jgi:hypothetical protein
MAQLGQIGSIDVFQLTQQIIHTGQRITDSPDPRLPLVTGGHRPRAAQKFGNIHIQYTGNALQRPDRRRPTACHRSSVSGS